MSHNSGLSKEKRETGRKVEGQLRGRERTKTRVYINTRGGLTQAPHTHTVAARETKHAEQRAGVWNKHGALNTIIKAGTI